MITETWQGLVDRLDHALAFATELQLDPTSSRFTSYRLRLAQLESTRVEKGDDGAFEQFRAEPDLNAVAFSEGQELGMIVPFLRFLPPAIAKKKLQVVLNGPELPSEEDSNLSLARNTMFELNVAARLQRAGISVEMTGAEADLEFSIDGLRWFGECKRPYSLKTIGSNLGRACEQLRVRLAGTPLAARGLVAMSISRPLVTRVPYLEFDDINEIRQLLRDRVGHIMQVMRDQIESKASCRRTRGGLALLMAHLIMPGWNRRKRMPIGIQHSVGTDIGLDGRRDGDRLWGIIDTTFTR